MERKSKLQMIAVDKLHPHPQNPRKVIGDVTELAESIKANGILQNLTVVPNNDDWGDNSGRMLMAVAYASCQRTYEKLSFIYVDYNSKTISRKNSPDLNKFYALLCKLGYVMSDEEIQLSDGTHPIFTTGEVMK